MDKRILALLILIAILVIILLWMAYTPVKAGNGIANGSTTVPWFCTHGGAVCIQKYG